MNDKPLVSLLIASYNHGKWLKELLNNLLDSTYDNMQVLISDDGSTDDSKKIIEAYCRPLQFKFKYVRIFHHQSNLGLKGRNNIQFLTEKIHPDAKYVQLLESDDVIYPSKTEKEVIFLEKTKYGMVHSNFEIELPNGKVLSDGRKNFPWGELPAPIGYVRDTLLTTNFVLTCTAMYRAHLYKKFFNYKLFTERGYILGDYPALLMMSKEHTFGYINEDLSKYRFNLESTCNNPENRSLIVMDTANIRQDALLGRL